MNGDGQQLMKAAAHRVFRQTSVSAKLRMDIELFEQRLLGMGSYMQVGEGEDKLFRYELNVQTDDHRITFLHVADGRFLWLRQEMPGAVDLGRVDLKRLRRELAKSEGSVATSDPSVWMALGGLSQLLAGLEANFDFGRIQLTTVGKTEMLSIEGVWNPNSRAPAPGGRRQAPASGGTAGEAGSLAPHVPQRVHVLLGRDDLFPYRIEYFHRDPATTRPQDPKAEQNAWKTVARLEWYDVNLRAGIDPLRFVYKPDATQIEDRTHAMLKSLRTAAAAHRN
jgi:hypothetical protein